MSHAPWLAVSVGESMTCDSVPHRHLAGYFGQDISLALMNAKAHTVQLPSVSLLFCHI